jgi:superfamily II DNA or RNA helicase
MSKDSTQKKALILTPSSLAKFRPFLKILYIKKVNGFPVFEEESIIEKELKSFNLSQSIYADKLLNFNDDNLAKLLTFAEFQVRNQHKSGDLQRKIKLGKLRKLHEMVAELRHFKAELKFYYKNPSGQNRFVNTPFTFSDFRPSLKFKVKANDAHLFIEPVFLLNGTPLPDDKVRRYEFLIESDNIFYQLSFSDFSTLHQLDDINMPEIGFDVNRFESDILSWLEKDYQVERNEFFDVEVIEAAPRNRVRLSEISNNFLVLNPEWDYDGFIVEPPFKKEELKLVEGKHYKILRNEIVEKEFVGYLKSLHKNFSNQLNGYYYLSFANAQQNQWFLKVFYQLLDTHVEVIGMDMLNHFRYSPHKISAKLHNQQQAGDKIIAELSISFGKEKVPAFEVKKIILSGQRAVMLRDGSMGILDEEFRSKYGVLLAHSKVEDNKIELPIWLSLSLQHAEGDIDLKIAAFKNEWLSKWAKWKDGEQVYDAPDNINATLRPYQQKGYEWMRLLSEAGGGGLLADDMGLGKTIQTIANIAFQSGVNPNSKHLIVCPASLMYNWQNELEKFAPQLKVLFHYGPGRNTDRIVQEEHKIIVSSYGTVRADIEKLTEIDFHTIIVDESHNIKNKAALTTRAVKQLRAKNRFALSGTPLMNNTFDLYSQYDFLLPGIFGSAEFFKREYSDPIDRDHIPEKVQLLQKITAPFLMRRTKEKVAADLPEKTEQVLWCSMYPQQRELYESIRESIKSSIFMQIKNEGLNKSKLSVLQGIMKLRQICNSPQLLKSDEVIATTDAVKIDVLLDELINNIADHKALVFSQFTSMLNLIAERLQKKGVKYFHFDGSTPPAKRMEMTDAFQQEDNKTNIFLISLMSGNAGLNLTAADYVFLVDPWWNVAVQQQAIDRTHRIGQTKKVFAYKMICKDTIEEKILSLQAKKNTLSEELVTADEDFVKTLSEDDVKWLFG